jgi:uncharacterized membrane protein YdjX (TVP38/TMEM64 family)
MPDHVHSACAHGNSHNDGCVRSPETASAAPVAPTWTARLLPFSWWRALPNASRLFALRVLLRVAFLALLVALIRAFPDAAMTAGATVLGWIHSHPAPAPELIFFAAAALFCAVSPTGYLPAVAAGIAFPPAASIPITYGSVLLGAALNVALVRGACGWRGGGGAAAGAAGAGPPPPPPRIAARYAARGAALLSGALRDAIAEYPILMVALLRLPFLGNGALNYVFSLHPLLPFAPMMAGNALGMALGSVLFPLAGSQVRSLGVMIAVGPGEGAARDAALGWFFGVLAVVALALAGAALVVRRVLRRIVAEKDAERAAGAAGLAGVAACAACACAACAAACAACAAALAPRSAQQPGGAQAAAGGAPPPAEGGALGSPAVSVHVN